SLMSTVSRISCCTCLSSPSFTARIFLFYCLPSVSLFFFFTAAAPTEFYTLSLHDALPILSADPVAFSAGWTGRGLISFKFLVNADRKSTRLNSSHVSISYAVFCLKKKKQNLIAALTRTARHVTHRLEHKHNPQELRSVFTW